MTTETNRDRFDAWPMAPMSTKSTKRFFLGGAISINNNTPPLLPTKVFRTPSVFLKSDDVKRVEEEEEENFLFFGDEVKGLMYFFGVLVLVCMYTVGPMMKELTMSTRVAFQITKLTKSFIADIALVRFLVRVKSDALFLKRRTLFGQSSKGRLTQP